MAGKQAKIVTDGELRRLLRLVRRHRYPARDRVMVLLSAKAGLRAQEIAGLTWSMVSRPDGRMAETIELRDRIAKKGSGRIIPMHRELRLALVAWARVSAAQPHHCVVASERGGGLSANSVVNWFAELYRRAGIYGCSSHSGRRTFITRLARVLERAGGSLRDVQQLAGHKSIEMTQRYIDGDTRVQRALIRLI